VSDYDWQPILHVRGGHRFFRDRLCGRVAVADDSGVYPESTQDGVLWVDETRWISIHESSATIPVIDPEGNRSSTTEHVDGALLVAARLAMPVALVRFELRITNVPVETMSGRCSCGGRANHMPDCKVWPTRRTQ
jgi:hypothetical protein